MPWPRRILCFKQGAVDSNDRGDGATVGISVGGTADSNAPAAGTAKRGGLQSGKDDDTAGEEVNRRDSCHGAWRVAGWKEKRQYRLGLRKSVLTSSAEPFHDSCPRILTDRVSFVARSQSHFFRSRARSVSRPFQGTR